MTSQTDNQVKPGARTESEATVRLHGVVRTPNDEAALNYYKAAFEQRRPDYVPDVIKLNNLVASDYHEHGYHAAPGEHKAESNQWGALSVKAVNGKMLGIKPGEYDVISWRPNNQAHRSAPTETLKAPKP